MTLHGRSDPVLPSPQVGSLLDGALAAHAEHLALANGDATLTFAEVAGAASRLAAALALAPGERVAVVAPNVPALVVGLFAAWRARAVAVPLSARLRGFELARVFADAEPVAAVSVAAHAGFALADEIEALMEGAPALRVCIVVDELGEVIGRSRRRAAAESVALGRELAAIMYTSGSTGEPKGALVTHGLAAAMAGNLADLLGEAAEDSYGLVVPASHAFGLGCLLCGLAAKATAVMVDLTASMDPLVTGLRRHNASVLHGSPALFGRLLRARADLSLRCGFTAGAWCPPDLLQALDEGGMRVLNLYGMTEIGAATSCRQDDPAQIRYRTVGRPLAGYELRIVAAPPPGPETAGGSSPGEVQVRTPHLASGYHGRPYNGEELADGGWFRTGDLGTLDAAGNLTIAGRANEVVHVAGFNVFPAEVESFLLTHPAIAQAAVIGVPHPVLGEAMQAFVTLVPGATLPPREIIRFARAGIAGYKVPYAIRVIDELPLLASGKPNRPELAGAASPDEVTG